MSTNQSFPVEVNRPVIFVPSSMPMAQVVRTMNENETSSVLVFDQFRNVCGIITERDIVRKFTLLDVDDKLERLAATLMSRPVRFVSVDSIRADIVRLFKECRFRHFPVTDGEGLHADNVVGIVSLTDLFRAQLSGEQTIESSSDKPRDLAVMTSSDESFHIYKRLFGNFQFQVQRLTDFQKFLKDCPSHNVAVLFDLDGYTKEQLRELILTVKAYEGQLAMTASSPDLVTGFRQYLEAGRQMIALKPIDITYVHWFFSQENPRN